jgi:hypothetical protein
MTSIILRRGTTTAFLLTHSETNTNNAVYCLMGNEYKQLLALTKHESASAYYSQMMILYKKFLVFPSHFMQAVHFFNDEMTEEPSWPFRREE